MLRFQITEDQQWMLLVEATDEVEKKQIEISLTQKINNFFFHPLVKKKIWDGAICFIEKKGTIWRVPIGLWREVMEIGDKYKIQIEISGLENIILSNPTLEEFTEWANEFFKDGVGGDSEKKLRPYQIETAWKIIRYRYSISEVATSAGKTLICFMILAYLKHRGWIRKFLMIVPTTNLVFQGNDDFEEYGIAQVGSKIQQIGGGTKLKEDRDVIIGTFQSLVKKEKEFFEGVDAVFVDECLHPDSKILMLDGKCVDIKDISVGDIVLTINEKTNKLEEKTVEYIYKNLNKGYQVYEIETESGKKLKLTGNHKLRLRNGKWKKVEDLDLTDELFDI